MSAPSVPASRCEIIEYRYDAFDRLIGRLHDADGLAGFEESEYYVHDSAPGKGGLDDIVLTYDENGNVVHRYLHGPGVDQVFCDESAVDGILWALADRQRTVRDWADYDGTTNSTSVYDHVVFDSFGQILSQSNGTHEITIGYTGRYTDPVTGLQWNRGRWYDPKVGRWLSEDSIGFTAGDVNLHRYVGNSVTNYTDPSGLTFITPEEWEAMGQDPYGDLTSYDPNPLTPLEILASTTPIPEPDHSGRNHNPIPKFVPPEWDKETVEDALDGIGKSIEERERKMGILGEDPPHRRQLAKERVWERKLKNRLRDLSHVGAGMMAIGSSVFMAGAGGSAVLIADDPLVIGFADDPLLIFTGGAMVVGGGGLSSAVSPIASGSEMRTIRVTFVPNNQGTEAVVRGNGDDHRPSTEINDLGRR